MNLVQQMKVEPDILDRMRFLISSIEYWRGDIKKALVHSHDTHTFDDLVQMVMANRLYFFNYPSCFLFMEVVEFPQFKVFHCFLGGGTIQGLIDAATPMEELGRTLGCKYLSIAGREGWKRVLTQHGWEPICLTMYRPIKDN